MSLREQFVMETDRLILRPFEESDAATVAALGRDDVKALFLPDWVKTEEQAAGLIRYFRESMEVSAPRRRPMVWAVVCKEDGSVIGHAGIGPKEELGGEVEIGYAVAEAYRGKGLAIEATKAVVWWAFERARVNPLAAIVLPANGASRRVLENIGFVPAGTRRLEHGGALRQFEYYRLYHLDWLPSPQWNPQESGEPMAAFFDRRVEGYEAHMLEDPDAESFYDAATEPIAITLEPIEVLDLGCGTGLELKGLFRRAPNARVTCVDLSTSMLSKLHANYEDRQGQIAVVQASYVDWNYPRQAFDVVLSVNTMHHFLEEPKVAIYRKIMESLKPGGIYIESDFMVDDIMMEQYRRRYRRIMDGAGGEGEPGRLHVDIPFTPWLQTRLLEHAGFSSVRSHLEHIRHEHSGAILVAKKEL